MSYLSATMPVNDDTVSRYSWSVHCATAAGKAKYAYCADPEPAAGGSTAPVAVPVTTVTTSPVNDDTVSRYSWEVHCATAAGKAKYAYCADPEPAAGAALMNLDMSNVKVMHLADWCLGNDSAKAKAICPKKATGEYSWEENHCQTAQ